MIYISLHEQHSVHENPVSLKKRSYPTRAPVCVNLCTRRITDVNVNLNDFKSHHLCSVTVFL